MRSKIVGLFVALGLVLSVFAVTAGPADAWLHVQNNSYTYKAPGPPPGPSGNHCQVLTKLTDGASKYAHINALNPPACVAVCVQVVMYANGTLFNGQYRCERTDDGNGINLALSSGVEPWIPP